MATFSSTENPTPFGFFNSDSAFSTEADQMVTFVKRRLGDDILSVELTKKQIWSCFEEAFMEYSYIINMHQSENTLMNMLGFTTGSFTSGSFNVGPHGKERFLQRENFYFPLQKSEVFSMEASVGGSYDQVSGSIQLKTNVQDYDLYTDLKNASGTTLYDTQPAGTRTKMRITEVYHENPQAAYRFFDTTSAINYLSNEFAFESFTPETVFYVLPVFEDVLRAGQMDLSNRVRRSNYSYQIIGTKLRIYPTPTSTSPKKLWVRVLLSPDPFNPSYKDDTLQGVNNVSNVPYGYLTYSGINSMGRQWVRQYAASLCKELLGLVRSKFQSVPIPGSELTLNGADLISQATTEKESLKTQLTEQLDKLTYTAMITSAADEAEALQRLLRQIPMPNGLAIFTG